MATKRKESDRELLETALLDPTKIRAVARALVKRNGFLRASEAYALTRVAALANEGEWLKGFLEGVKVRGAPVL